MFHIICLTITAFLLTPLAAIHAAEPVAIDVTKRTWQGIPGLERTAKGRVFASWFTGGPKEPSPDNTVLLSHSDDRGKTFSPPEAIALPTSDGTRCYDPTLWIDPKGRLWYIFNRGNKETAKHDVWARICDNPDAKPPVFGTEFRVGYDVPFAFRMNKVTVLSSGEWIMPVTLAEKAVRGWSTGYNDQQTPTLHGVGVSTDEGRTWKLHGAVKSRPWALENMITELKDGRLWMLIRTSAGVLWQSHSTDKGRTWSEGTATAIKSPGSRFFIRRLASGNLLLVNHDNFTGRSHLTAQLSTDDGATWNDGLLLDERSGVSYPDGVQDKDGLIWITYDRDRNGTGEILLAKFREEDVVAGNDVSRTVTLKHVISKLDKPSLLPLGWDPKRAGDEVLSKLIKVSAPQVKGAHDADLVLVGERAFIVEHDNDIKPGHGAGKAQYCVLTVVNVKTMSVERIVPMAKSAQSFANETLPVGACFVPRIIQLNDTTLRCFFACEDQSGKSQSQTWYCDFDIASLTFAPEIHRVKLKTSDGTFDMQPQYFHADAAKHGFKQPAKAFGLYLLDAFKVIDGKTYLAINNFPGAQNAFAMLNDSRDTIEVIGHYNEPAERRLTESSVNRLPDGTWMAICRTESGDRNYVFTTSKDGKTWTQGEPCTFISKGSNSKPTFDKFNGLYYLGWQEATRITDGHGVGRYIFNIEVSRDGLKWERKYRFESTSSFQYPTFREHEGNIWFTVTQGTGGSTDRIMFGKLEDLPKSTAKQGN
jgi:predicted neuraminidase